MSARFHIISIRLGSERNGGTVPVDSSCTARANCLLATNAANRDIRRVFGQNSEGILRLVSGSGDLSRRHPSL
jgi:hypothetical protein